MSAIMVGMSKQQFYEKFGNDVRCSQIHSAIDKSCGVHLWSFYRLLFIGSIKFFFPLSLLTVLLNRRNRKRSMYVDFSKTLMRRSLFAFLFGNISFASICLTDKCFGRVNYYQVGFFPGVFGALASLAGNQSDRILDTIISVSTVMESFFHWIELHNVVSLTSLKLTTMFMLNNAFLMYLLNKRNEEKSFLLWFYIPKITEKIDPTSTECTHGDSCYDYCFEGIKTYFLFGFAWDIIRKILYENVRLLYKPYKIPQLVTNRKNYHFSTFLGLYVGIYRIIVCFLTRKRLLKTSYRTLVAGLLAGLSYGIRPNISILCLGITTTFQLLCGELEKKYKYFKRTPAILPLFMCCQGLLMHERLVIPEICPRYYKKLIFTLTCGQIEKICETVYQ